MGSGGTAVSRLRQEGKLALPHEVKLLGVGSGGAAVGRLCQEGNLALLHEVKLWEMCGDFWWLTFVCVWHRLNTGQDPAPSIPPENAGNLGKSPSRGAFRPPSSSSPGETVVHTPAVQSIEVRTNP